VRELVGEASGGLSRVYSYKTMEQMIRPRETKHSGSGHKHIYLLRPRDPSDVLHGIVGLAEPTDGAYRRPRAANSTVDAASGRQQPHTGWQHRLAA
jgi:hypothetical protein